ncbi:GntR family transcriptional regulator, partial [Longimicrobium sp.]|uniref:GntR family transcriptional regulator n=1 Tax=Longimicrobium sp. TaxID=2029185 RepID=UPI002F94EA1C
MALIQQADERYAYARLAADIESLVRAGTLGPGERLPSVRRMSVQRGVSLPTVVQAYRLLETRRVIRARPQSGFYVLPPSRPNLIEARGAETLADPGEVTTGDLIMRVLEMVANPALVPLGTALPEPDLLPTAELSRCLGRVARRQAGHRAAELAPSGVEALRQQVARRALEAGCARTADDVVITCGAAEAIHLALRALTRPGDTVAV